MALMLILITPLYAHAAYLYTYTGNTFSEGIFGSEFTTSDFITVTFTFDPDHYPGARVAFSNGEIPFNISCADVILTVPGTDGSIFNMSWDPSTGQPLTWYIGAQNGIGTIANPELGLVTSENGDEAYHWPGPDGQFPWQQAITYARGTWTLTPIAVEPCECDLNHDGKCNMSDWLLFGQRWGATNCNTVPCACDLNADGRCNMSDWLLFGQDWERTDCPVP